MERRLRLDRVSIRGLVGAAAGASLLTVVAACSGNGAPPAPASDDGAAALYPTLAALYEGPQGIYAGCGPNNGVCHNSKQFPDLSSLGSVVDHVGDPCNQLVDQPSKMHDLCERRGDFAVVDGMRAEIGRVERIEGDGLSWRIVLAAPYQGSSAATGVRFERDEEAGARVINELYDVTLAADPADANAVLVTLPAEAPELGDEDPVIYMRQALDGAGVPADPTAVSVGDPNGNGVFGATLGGRLIDPGHPERSFLLRRLTDPAAGSLMPLANCCHWRMEAVRALWCWTAGLSADGANALEPIDYQSCPPGPTVDHLVYPVLGEACEGSGACPVQSNLPSSDEPTWSNVYGNVMTRRCAGGGCHFDGDGAKLPLDDEDTAYQHLVGGGLVVPGDPSSSVLVQRITRTCAPGASCDRMPLGLDPLPAAEIEALVGWVAAGAPR
jgi:hypothetical protein